MASKHILWRKEASEHGSGTITTAWHPESTHVAICGSNRVVRVYDRHGEVVADVPLSGTCVGMDWDKDGDTLAVIQSSSGVIVLWDIHSQKVQLVETNLQNLSYLKWSRIGPQLAVGTAKGTLLVYNKKTSKKIPVKGKHSKRISSGAWNDKNLLALVADDQQLTISSAEGDLVQQAKLVGDPSTVHFSCMKSNKTDPYKENTVSVICNKKILYLYVLETPDQPYEVQFLPTYGSIVSYQWYGDGYIMVGFSSGYVVVISSHVYEIGHELFSHQWHKEGLSSLRVSGVAKKAATCGGRQVKIIDLADWKEVKSETIIVGEGSESVVDLQWSPDGQILTAWTESGEVLSFLTQLPSLAAVHGSCIAHMTSLREFAVIDANNVLEQTPVQVLKKVEVSIEPSVITLGPRHLAIAMNNCAWFYDLGQGGDGPSPLVSDRTFAGSVTKMALGEEYVAVLLEKQIILHVIVPRSDGHTERDSIALPSSTEVVEHIFFSGDMLIYATTNGTVHHFLVPEWSEVNEYKHGSQIRILAPNPIGTRVIVVDVNNRAVLYNPVDDSLIEVPEFSATTQNVLWDSADPGVFLCMDAGTFREFVYEPYTIDGAKVTPLGDTTPRPAGYKPLLVYNGRIACQVESGSLAVTQLVSHDAIQIGKVHVVREELLLRRFYQMVRLRRFDDALSVIRRLQNMSRQAESPNSDPGGSTAAPIPIPAVSKLYKHLMEASMKALNISIAVQAAHANGDPGMVMALNEIARYDEHRLLAGHVCSLLGDYTKAQDLFLSSSQPRAALDMRADVFHWDHALSLAKAIAPREIPSISRSYAQQLEFRGEYQAAYDMYTKGDETENKNDPVCIGGQARCLIRLGSIQRGMSIVEDPVLARECAIILENLKQWAEAAALYERGGQFDKAAFIHIQTKNFARAAPLMSKITAPRIHLAYARACEAAGNFTAAETAYEAAKEFDEVVRVNLEKLKNLQKAFDMVRKTKSEQGAMLVAKFCQKSGDVRAAVEFLLLARKNEEAIQLAIAHDQIEAFAQSLGDNGTIEEYTEIAKHFEVRGAFSRAGQYHLKCRSYDKALKLFMKCGDKEIDRVIEVVGLSGSEKLARTVISFLLGEDGKAGSRKDPKYIFKLYMALKRYRDASHASVAMARQEVELGNVKVGRDTIYHTLQQLRAVNFAPPRELLQLLVILHSYVLVKVRVKLGDHEGAARLLKRVSANISLFPLHVVPILTLCVIECQRAGLRKSAFEFASTLMRKEYRDLVDAKFRQKIERIVRKPDKSEEPAEDVSPCPICAADVANTSLDCHVCKNTLPMCIMTGLHMVINDWAHCPSCNLPVLRSGYNQSVSAFGGKCPLCETEVPPTSPHMTVEEARDSLSSFLKREEEEI